MTGSLVSRTRMVLGALALATVAACGGTTDFELTRTFQVQGTGTIAGSESVSLADEAGEAWDHRDNIDDVRVKSVVATITAVAPGNTAPSGALEGTLSRGAGAGSRAPRWWTRAATSPPARPSPARTSTRRAGS